ncbi:MAG: hypothetical protein U1F11_10295 [Steroidobacteraceae bacterium]
MSQGALTLDLTPNDSAVRRDPVAQLALTLAKELWMLRDRQLVLEEVLSREGLRVRELVERFQPDGAFRQALEAERERFVGEVLAALQPPGDRR